MLALTFFFFLALCPALHFRTVCGNLVCTIDVCLEQPGAKQQMRSSLQGWFLATEADKGRTDSVLLIQYCNRLFDKWLL